MCVEGAAVFTNNLLTVSLRLLLAWLLPCLRMLLLRLLFVQVDLVVVDVTLSLRCCQ